MLRPIVQSLVRGQPLLLAAFARYLVDIEIAISSAGKEQELAVRRPAVQIGWTDGGDPAGLASFDRDGINVGPVLILLRMMTDGYHLSFESEDLIIVVIGGV